MAVAVTEYSYTGTIAFDSTAGAQQHTYGTSACPATIVLPTITPTSNGSLVHAEMLNDQGGPGSPGAPWTQVGTFGDYYVLSSSGTVTPSFPDTFGAGDSCGVVVAAFH